MRDTSFPFTTPFPELSEKLDLLFIAFTKSVKVMSLAFLGCGFFFVHKIPSVKFY